MISFSIFLAVTIAGLAGTSFYIAKKRGAAAWVVLGIVILIYGVLISLLFFERVDLSINQRGEHVVTRFGPAWPGPYTTVPAPGCQEGDKYYIYQQRPGGGNCEDFGPLAICTKGRLTSRTCSQFTDFGQSMIFIWK